jgi:hypothetical protein
VNGDLLEAKMRSAELSDVEPDDFVRFLEYAYRGDYTIPSGGAGSELSQPIPGTAALVIRNAPEPEDSSALYLGQTKLQRKRAMMDARNAQAIVSPRSMFDKRTYMARQTQLESVVEGFQPKLNSSPEYDFTPVLLAHARLYTFADMRLVHPLKELALHKLHTTLVNLKVQQERIGDVLQLARYTYDNGPGRSDTGVVNDLRQLVVEYMACEVGVIGKHPAFKTLLEEGGEFVSDFWDIVLKHSL